jgi:hypothetical protein
MRSLNQISRLKLRQVAALKLRYRRFTRLTPLIQAFLRSPIGYFSNVGDPWQTTSPLI